MHSRGHICDILDWGRIYKREEMAMMAEYYDCIYGVPGETWPLTDNHGIPHEKIVVVAHGEYDLHHFVDTRPAEEIERFAGYAVISDLLAQQSADIGIRRVPKVVKYGVNYRRLMTTRPSELKVVGYGGSMHRNDHQGLDWKRGNLAQQATEMAGLVFGPLVNSISWPCHSTIERWTRFWSRHSGKVSGCQPWKLRQRVGWSSVRPSGDFHIWPRAGRGLRRL